MSRSSKEEHVHRVFESIAPQYDRMNSLLSFRIHKWWRRFAMKKMDVHTGQSAIDICCGTCDWTLRLAEAAGSDGEIVGLDFSENMLDIGRKKLSEHTMDQIELVVGNAMSLPYGSDHFDYATIGFALRNVGDITQVLNEMKRVVKPGGMVVSLELSKPVWPGFKQIYYLYFNVVLPFLGKLFANRYKQYSWLPESLKHFPDSDELAAIFEEVGLEKVETYRLSGGIAALHLGRKPKEV